MADGMALVRQKIEAYTLEGTRTVGAPNGITLFSASPQSPLANLVATLGPKLASKGVTLRVVFATTEADGLFRDFMVRMGTPSADGAAQTVRWTQSANYLRCHEQLVLGEHSYLSGPTVKDVLQGDGPLDHHLTDRPQDIAAARFAFEMLWKAATPHRCAQQKALSASRFASAGFSLLNYFCRSR